MTDLHYLPAVDALRMFASGGLSPVELAEAVIKRAEAVEPVINAFAATRYEQALEAARAAEARYAGRGPAPRALEGLMVAVKEEAPIGELPSGGEGGAGSLPLCGSATVDGEFLADDIGAIRDVPGTVTQS